MATIELLPATLDLTLYRGNDVSILVEIHVRNSDGSVGAAVDLTDYVGLAQIRANATSNTVIATFDITIDADQVTNRGQLTLSMAHVDTKELPPSTTPYAWDLQLVDGDGLYDTYLEGDVTVIADVSRDD